MVAIRVPASSANLGPGFDCLGLGLRLYFKGEAGALPQGRLAISGCPPSFRGEDNLVFRSFLHTLAILGERPMGLRLRVDSAIPPARGLGSSAAAVACGAAAALVFTGRPPDKDVLFRITAGFEGHGDNAAAAVFGGLRSVSQQGKEVLTHPLILDPSWRFTALIPAQQLSTAAARQALPGQVPLGDAAFNVGRAVLTVKALETGDLSLLRQAMQDRLHQPFRLPLVAGGEAVLRQAQQLGAAVYLSGAGPTLMCVHQEKLSQALSPRLPPGWQALGLQPDLEGIQIQ